VIEEPEETAGQPEAQPAGAAEAAPEGPSGGLRDATTPSGEASGESVEDPAEATVEQDLNSLVEEARSQRDEYLQLAQRTKADFDNYRKRMAAESQAQVERGRLEVVTGLIGAIDNLERVLEAVGIEQSNALEGEIPSDAPVSEQGVIVSYRDLNAVLKKAGVEAFDSKGETFDPNLHEALQALPAEGVESGVVIEVMQKGYRAGENVIRHARVVVSQ
jgi:molecular chaperone GrpE